MHMSCPSVCGIRLHCVEVLGPDRGPRSVRRSVDYLALPHASLIAAHCSTTLHAVKIFPSTVGRTWLPCTLAISYLMSTSMLRRRSIRDGLCLINSSSDALALSGFLHSRDHLLDVLHDWHSLWLGPHQELIWDIHKRGLRELPRSGPSTTLQVKDKDRHSEQINIAVMIT